MDDIFQFPFSFVPNLSEMVKPPQYLQIELKSNIPNLLNNVSTNAPQYLQMNYSNADWSRQLFKGRLWDKTQLFNKTIADNSDLASGFANTLNLKREKALLHLNSGTNWSKIDAGDKFLDNTAALQSSIDLGTGLTLQDSSDAGTLLLGKIETNDANPSPSKVKGATDKLDSLASNTNLMNGIAMGSDLVNSLLGERSEYSGKYGSLAKGLDSAYDTTANTLMQSGNPYGMMAGAAMKLNGALSKGVGKLGGGTDGMTAQDAILGSAFMLMTPFGLVNGFGGKRVDTITADEDTRANVGASYGGTFDKVDDALTKSGKKYGLFSNSARNQANQAIQEAKRQQFVAAGISKNAQDLFNIQGSMSAINDNRRAYLLQGGWGDGQIVFGRKGTKLPEEEITFEEEPIITFEEEIVEKFEEGGKFNVIPEGALHARKHNIDIDGITKKGIPVVSEDENGKVELQAEVEVNEIILRLELTKKLEELSRMDSDKSAIEAGKLLVDEILNNTIDNTNLIQETK